MEVREIQLLRFLAAGLVVVSHTSQAIGSRVLGLGPHDYWETGAFGVDIFFVISGLVMSLSTSNKPDGWNSAWQFAKKRLLRVVPLYWLFTGLKILLALAVPALALKTILSGWHISTSLLFWPALAPWGEIVPVLPVGWTLMFEMFFYTAFALAIGLHARKLLLLPAIFLLVYALSHSLPGNIALRFYASEGLLFEFLLGIAIGELLKRSARLMPLLSLVAIFLAVTFVLAISPEIKTINRFFIWGLPSAVIVAATVLCRLKMPASALRNRLVLLGDASYALYLLHPFSIPITLIVLLKLGVSNLVVMTVTCAVVAVIASVLVHLWIEVPLTKRLKPYFERRKALVTASAAPAVAPN